MIEESDAAEAAGHSAYQRLRASPGQAFVDRAHLRTFSLNILQINGLELLDTVRRLSDPQDGLSLMTQDNREAGDQAHRELCRHLHNFLAAAKTLVDHTRALMEANYVGTTIGIAYAEKAGQEVGADPMVRFVHDLRNYIMHRGVPPTERFLEFARNPSAPDREFSAVVGVRLHTARLQRWDGWVASSRAFLRDAGEFIDIGAVVEGYLIRIAGLHAWLDGQLATHHAADLDDLARLQVAFHDAHPAVHQQPASPVPSTDDDSPFTFRAAQKAGIDVLADSLFAKIRPLVLEPRGEPAFPSLRSPAVMLTDKDLADTPTYFGPDAQGRPVVAFIWRDAETLGLDERDFDDTAELARLAHASAWARDGFDLALIEDTFISWARARLGAEDGECFSARLLEAAREVVLSRQVWAPVANLEIEQAFTFGPIRFTLITPETLADFRRRGQPAGSAAEESIDRLFAELKRDFQGLAAVVVELTATPKLAEAQALPIARDAVALLRFLWPGAAVVDLLCPIELHGAERMPSSRLWTVSEDNISMAHRLLSPAKPWRISVADLDDLRAAGLDLLGGLLVPEGLNPFASIVRASLLLYSRSLALLDPRQRLGQALAALEVLLLRHQMEPRAATVSDRASLLVGDAAEGRREMHEVFRRGYRFLESASARPLAPGEVEFVRTVVFCAHTALRNVVLNLPGFATHDDFLAALEQARG